MREIGLPGQPDLGELLPGADRLPRRDGDAALLQVAIERVVALGVVEHHGIAAIAMLRVVAGDGVDADVRHAVAHLADGAVGGGEHGDARAHRREVLQADVGAVMAVLVGLRAAAIVQHAGAGIAVDVILHEAIGTDMAGQRPAERERQRGHRRQQQKKRGEFFHGASSTMTGTWSDAMSQPRASRTMWPPLSDDFSPGDSQIWSSLRPRSDAAQSRLR